jgi:hypothetical protein
MSDGCGCERCRALPEEIHNRPGLPALAYRFGAHPSLLRRLLARLPFFEVIDEAGRPARPLAALTTRETGDPSIALLDAWATVGDVLTFYQERIANEGFLRTAIEHRSIVELARSIGYEPAPGLTASTHLAFVIEDAPGAPGQAQIDAGLRIQSVPGQNERPLTFETVEGIEARIEWNEMRTRTTRPQRIAKGTTSLLLDGLDTRLQPGDVILIVGDERVEYTGSERWDVRVLDEVVEDFEQGRTRVAWKLPLGHDAPTVSPAKHPRVYAFRHRAALFGHNAPDFRAMPLEIKQAYDPDYPDELDRRRTQWPDFDVVRGDDPVIDLDAVYPKVLAGTWLALVKPSYTELYRVVEAEAASRTAFTLTSKTTRVALDTREHLLFFGLRDTLVLAESEELVLAEEPVAEPVEGDAIVLAEDPPPLSPGRRVVVTGRPTDAEDGVTATEVAVVEGMAPGEDGTILELEEPLKGTYEVSSVVITGNIVRATHGETVADEVLGSGRGELANQSFELKKPPLTYVSASNARGAASTLTVRVDGIEWTEAPTLFGANGRAQVYVVQTDDDGTTRVVFGDGSSGARPPTGTENIRATYRSGLGAAGNLPPGRISLLLTRPLGVRSVANPVAAEGGTDPESLDDARRNAPVTVLTLDRLVSLRDYEDLARAFAGVGKARATALWDGEKRLVHLTIAGVGGATISPSSDVFEALEAAIQSARDPAERFVVANYEPCAFALSERILVAERFVAADVLSAVRDALMDAFSFEGRDFGQPVTAAEVIAVSQSVDGVVAVDLDELYETEMDEHAGDLRKSLPSLGARLEDGVLLAAQLRTLDPAGAEITEMTL